MTETGVDAPDGPIRDDRVGRGAAVGLGGLPSHGGPTGDGGRVEAVSPASPRPSGRRRRRSPLARRLLIGLGAAIGLIVVVFFAAAFWVGGHLGGSGGAEVDVTIPPGTSTGGIVNVLARDGVVSDAWLFRLYLRYEGASGFVAGKYAFHHHEGYSAALKDLHQGPKVVLAKLTIPEGFTLGQIAERVGHLPGHTAASFLAVAQSGAVRSSFEPPGSNNLEGLVFPDTYFVQPDETDQDLLQQMVSQFDQVTSDLGMDTPGSLPNGLTAYQTVVVASMVEREAKVPEDRGMIARVILNRLQRGMKLQIDATVLYALGIQTTNITKSDLNVNSPFNTYRVAGLPPSPISNPGRASLLAALSPTPGSWLYYVLADASGKHAFATTEAQFLQLEAQARASGLLG